MEFEISCHAVKKAITHIMGAVNQKQTLPALSHILVEANEKITLVGSDCEIELTASIDQLPKEPGAVCLPGKRLADIVRNLPSEGRLSCSMKGQQARLSCGASRFVLSTLPAQEFPRIQAEEHFDHLTVGSHVLLGLIKGSGFAMGQKDVRYYLNGMLLSFNSQGIQCVASDGHRMVIAQSQLSQMPSKQAKQQIIVPRKAIGELGALLAELDESDVMLQFSGRHVRIQAGGRTVTSKLIDGQYPDYTAVIPKHLDKTAQIDRGYLQEALKRTSTVCSDRFRGVRFDLKTNQLSIRASNLEQEEAEDHLPIDYPQEEGVTIGLDAGYVLDALNAIDSDMFTLHFGDASSSVIVAHQTTDYSSQCIIMPVSL